MYLLNKPVKKQKSGWYNKQTKELVNNSVTSKEVIEENNKALDDFHTITSN